MAEDALAFLVLSCFFGICKQKQMDRGRNRNNGCRERKQVFALALIFSCLCCFFGTWKQKQIDLKKNVKNKHMPQEKKKVGICLGLDLDLLLLRSLQAGKYGLEEEWWQKNGKPDAAEKKVFALALVCGIGFFCFIFFCCTCQVVQSRETAVETPAPPPPLHRRCLHHHRLHHLLPKFGVKPCKVQRSEGQRFDEKWSWPHHPRHPLRRPHPPLHRNPDSGRVNASAKEQQAGWNLPRHLRRQ